VDSRPVRQLLRCLSGGREPTTDWNGVVALAVFQGLAPLLFRRLKNDGERSCVPVDAWERLRLAYFDAADRNLHLLRELRPVLQRLRGAGVRVTALKGVYLAEAVYGDVALRPMCDVDLMVPRAELAAAQSVLLDMGGVYRPPEDIELWCQRWHSLPHFAFHGLTVEVHWNIVRPAGPVNIDAAGLWTRARPATVAGVEVLALSPEDLLLHLCLHFGYHHRLTRLRYFCDIAETIRRLGGELDWTKVVDRAREWNASRYVGLTFHLARGMLGASVPGHVLERLVPGGPDRRVLDAATESVLTRTPYEDMMPLFEMLAAKSIGDKTKLFWRRVFLSREEMAAKYPASRESRHLGFYFMLRLRDVVWAFAVYNLRRYLLRMRDPRRGRKAALANWLKSGKP